MTQPLTPEEEFRFQREMAVLVVQKLTEGGRFRISADTPDLIRMFQNVTSLAAELMGQPVYGYGNGREYFITLAPQEMINVS
ncbi:hypothetical protein GCM10027589_43160 [Actinocorallia lasiicapitis]